jgi:hypothetical protein
MSGHSIVQYIRNPTSEIAENCNKGFINCKFCLKLFKDFDQVHILLLSDPDQTGPFPDPAMPDPDPYPSWSAVGALFHATLETSLFEQINDMENIVEKLMLQEVAPVLVLEQESQDLALVITSLTQVLGFTQLLQGCGFRPFSYGSVFTSTPFRILVNRYYRCIADIDPGVIEGVQRSLKK